MHFFCFMVKRGLFPLDKLYASVHSLTDSCSLIKSYSHKLFCTKTLQGQGNFANSYVDIATRSFRALSAVSYV